MQWATDAPDDLVQIQIRVSWVDLGDPQGPKPSIKKTFRLTPGQILIHLNLSEGKSNNRLGLMRNFSNSVAGLFRSDLQKSSRGMIHRLTGKINSAFFESILCMLVTRGLLRPVAPPKYVVVKRKYWELTEKGILFVAETVGKLE
jgi:hypothetical protein